MLRRLLRSPSVGVLLFSSSVRGMKYRVLGEGAQALTVSEACLGTMTWGEQNSEEEAHAQLDYALSQGVNFIDTAELYPVVPRAETYGLTERFIGNWLAKDPSRRAKIVLATKVAGNGRGYIPALRRRDLGLDLDPSSDALAPPADDSALTREQIHEALEASLLRLQTSYVDLYQLHWPARYTPIFAEKRYERRRERPQGSGPGASPSIDEQVRAVGDLIASGKVRAWGLSNENGVGVTLFLEACKRLGVPPPATVQNDFSLAHRKFEEDGTAEACSPLTSGATNGVALLAYGALAGGTLAGKVKDGTAPEGSRHVRFPNFQPRYYSQGTLEVARAVADLAARLNSEDGAAAAAAAGTREKLTPAQLALYWTRRREFMGSVIVGATSLPQLAENLAAFDDEGLQARGVLARGASRKVDKEVDALEESLSLGQAYYSGVNPGAIKAAVEAEP